MERCQVYGACVAVLLILPIAACDSRSPTSGMTPTSPLPPPPVPLTLSGQVFDVTPGSRVPVADFSVLVVVRPSLGGFWTYEKTTTGPDGRYHFPDLPAGSAVVLANSATHRQLCGAAAVLGVQTRLDVEITSRANPQPSPTRPPLRVTGQIYETTPAGRVGISGAVIYMEHSAPDAPFLYVYADAGGYYTACGIPANWPIAFWLLMWHQGYEDPYEWHQFSADTTLDIELKRR